MTSSKVYFTWNQRIISQMQLSPLIKEWSPPDAVISLNQRRISQMHYLPWTQISPYMIGQHWCSGWCMKGQSWNAWHETPKLKCEVLHKNWAFIYIIILKLFISHQFKTNYPTSYLTSCKCFLLPQLVRTNMRLMC